jgi:tetratricopeptide (TPR) repeat protein
MSKINKLFATTALTVGLAVSLPMSGSIALASGGGGGSGGNVGGSAAPQYDAEKEYKKGFEALEAKEFKKASTAFSRVLKVAKKDANSNYLMGMAQTGLEKHKKAARYYKLAAKYNPDMFQAYTAMAAAYMAAEKPEDAQEVLAGLDGRLAECGETCAQKAALEQTRSEVQTVLDGGAIKKESFLNPAVTLAKSVRARSDGAQYFDAVALINQENYQAAIDDLTVLARTIGPHPDVMNYLGYANRKLGQYERAEHYYGVALSVDADHRGANEYLGELYVETGQIEKAKAQLAKLENICSFGCIEEVELRGWIIQAAP